MSAFALPTTHVASRATSVGSEVVQLEAFCDEMWPQLVGTLTVFTGDRTVAEELAQETLTRVWQRWPRVSGLDNPHAWAHRVARNLATSWWRRRQAERRARTRHGDPDIAVRAPDPSDDDAVRLAVASLPERQRAVLAWRYFADLTVAETARVLGCPEGTVTSDTHRALVRLRQDHGDELLGLLPDEEVRDGR